MDCISSISNSVTHLLIYTNSAITDIGRKLCAGCWYICAELSATPFQFVLEEQSYSSLHSGWSLACDYFRSDIANPCSIIRIPEAIGSRTVVDAAMEIVARLTKQRKT